MIMFHSARSFIDREDAVTAGRHAGGAYALVILIVLAFMTMTDNIHFTGSQNLFLGAAIIIGLRVGMEMWAGHRWDHYEQKRQNIMRHEGVTWQDAFDRVRRH